MKERTQTNTAEQEEYLIPDGAVLLPTTVAHPRIYFNIRIHRYVSAKLQEIYMGATANNIQLQLWGSHCGTVERGKSYDVMVSN